MIELKVKTLITLREKFVGLIGVKKLYPIYLRTRWGIHTFGVLFPIDVLILDDSKKVVMIHHMRPDRIFFWNPKYKHVVELPQGIVKEKRIHLGHQIGLSENTGKS